MNKDITVRKSGDWTHIRDVARDTAGMPPSKKPPSDKLKRKYLISEHSPIRLMEYDIRVDGIPYYSAMHLRTHNTGVKHEPLFIIESSRPDISNKVSDRDKLPQTAPVIMNMRINPQALINISRQRLCAKTDKTTRQYWADIVKCVGVIEPTIVDLCVPNCVYRGFCPEFSSCGFAGTGNFVHMRNKYIDICIGGEYYG